MTESTKNPKSAWSFRNSPIRIKLLLLMAFSSGFALLLAGISFFAYEAIQYRSTAARGLTTMADIGGGTMTAPLAFGDQRAATESLGSLRADPSIVAAGVYDKSDRLFAAYRDNRALSVPLPAQPRAPGLYFENGNLLAYRPIVLQGERIGTIYLRSNLSDIYSRLFRYSGIVGIVLLASLGLALMLSSWLQVLISAPIVTLAGIARRVSVEKNYSLRATSTANDETGVLIDSFNEMLSQIGISEKERQLADEKLRESEERYALAARGSNDGLWDWKLDTGEIYFSPRWIRMLGFSDHELSLPEDWLGRIHPADRERVRAQLAAHLSGSTPEFSSEYRIRHRNGQYIWMLMRGIAIRDEKGAATRIAGSQTDITEGKVSDALTELPNRLYLIDKLESVIESRVAVPLTADRRATTFFAVLFLDVDRFKIVNDRLGHAAGDQLLIGIAQRLRASVRGIAAAGTPIGAPSSVVRLGGDEFAILLDGLSSEDDAAIVAERILANMEPAFYLDGRPVFATLSIGIAMGTSANTPEDLLRNADTAMYYSKLHGRGRFEVFNQGMRERALARMEIEADLKKALVAHEFVLHYQAKVSLLLERITGFEALVRWNHPTRGLLFPSEFIPVAEETGLVIPLGRWVLHEACRQMAAWHKAVPRQPPLAISVNVSFKQLSEAGLPEDVESILAETGLDAKSLRLEITESSVMENPDFAVVALKRFKELGIALEIDDFGTGYSSLSYLRQLPFDTVKIDRSFVRELGTADDTSEILRTILQLARSLGMDVIAEGVETKDQLARLTALGCGAVQGFYFSKPVEADSARLLIEDKQTLEHGFLMRPALNALNAALSAALNTGPKTPLGPATTPLPPVAESPVVKSEAKV